MQSSNHDISKQTIEQEIYNTFVQLKQEKEITIADYLNRLHLPCFEKKYRSIKFPYESLFKLLIFQKLKGIRFQSQLERYLRMHRQELHKLNMTNVPDQRTISHFINTILGEEPRQLIDFITTKINEISSKFGILLDTNILQSKQSKEQAERTFYHNKSLKTKEISILFKKRFSSVIDLNIGKNSIYQKHDFIDLMLHMCNTNDFAENGSKTFQLQRTKTPNGDTLLYHLKDYNDVEQIKRIFFSIFEMIWETARKANQFQRIVDCSIDYTSWHFYGDKNAPMVTDMKPDRGTTHCYKFATITISERNQRFTLLAIPVGPFDNKQEALRALIEHALQRVKIRRLYVDRGFFDSESVELFKYFHLKFLMPCTANERIKKILEVMPAPTVIKDYEMKESRFNIILVNDEFGVKRAFATNIDFNENDVDLAERLFYLYSKRWGIETSYRVKKHSFRPKTTSKNYFIRLFYFMFSVLLYNLWLLADILVCLAVIGVFNGDHLITSKYFCSILVSVDPGG
ncbi:MAG TPA: transposase [Candidatus Thermoplasmatota archaeon]|nr:transposase [Candidatus Thermoplasmatota archaeon]